MKKCFNCDEIYNDDWYSCPKCGAVLEDTDEAVSEQTTPVEPQNPQKEIVQAPPFSKLPVIFYFVGFIIIFVGTIITLFFIPKELLLILTMLWATFVTSLLFIGFGKVIELLDTIKWKL